MKNVFICSDFLKGIRLKVVRTFFQGGEGQLLEVGPKFQIPPLPF